jgi:acyl-CoA thioesterase-2
VPHARRETTSFTELMQLVTHGPDTYVGTGPNYPWEGLYGGQVVAQALSAARLTLREARRPHSLHAYFIRLGDASEPVRFEVERLRDGRSFAARQVVARQSTGAILNMSASFQMDTPTPMDIQLAQAPRVARPEEGKDVSWGPLLELRLVDPEPPGGSECGLLGAQRLTTWFRLREALSDDPVHQAAALAYASDSGPAWIVGALHQAKYAPPRPWRPLSLDHALWFHRPFDVTDWLLLDASVASLYNSRSLASGQVFSRQGDLVASVAQEVLLRKPRDEL